MKIWVCREWTNSSGESWYLLIDEECKPRRIGNGKSGDFWSCRCVSETHKVAIHCEDGFKENYGLERHLKPGTKKLMTWTLPLARQPKGKK